MKWRFYNKFYSETIFKALHLPCFKQKIIGYLDTKSKAVQQPDTSWCRLRKFSISRSPSRSISYTLMASWVLSGRNSLAGSVCLLCLPGDTDRDDGCMSLVNGCAPATDTKAAALPQNFSCCFSVRASHENDFSRTLPAEKKNSGMSAFIEEL